MTTQSASSLTSLTKNSPTMRDLLFLVSCLNLYYTSVKLMDNSGVFISLWIFLLFFVIILLISRQICKCICCVRSSARLLRCVIWGPILRTFLVTFLELGFCAYINIFYVIFFFELLLKGFTRRVYRTLFSEGTNGCCNATVEAGVRGPHTLLSRHICSKCKNSSLIISFPLSLCLI